MLTDDDVAALNDQACENNLGRELARLAYERGRAERDAHAPTDAARWAPSPSSINCQGCSEGGVCLRDWKDCKSCCWCHRDLLPPAQTIQGPAGQKASDDASTIGSNSEVRDGRGRAKSDVHREAHAGGVSNGAAYEPKGAAEVGGGAAEGEQEAVAPQGAPVVVRALTPEEVAYMLRYPDRGLPGPLELAAARLGAPRPYECSKQNPCGNCAVCWD